MPRINVKETEFLAPDKLKCSYCGREELDDPDRDYGDQSRCRMPDCEGQMMSWLWYGWKTSELRSRWHAAERELAEIRGELPVCQDCLPLETFTVEARSMPWGEVIDSLPYEAPWMTAFGAGLINIYGMRLRGTRVEFGIGNEDPPILAWVERDAFMDHWPK